MRWSPERLRWLLLGCAVALAAVIAALFGLSSYRAGKIWQRILARNGVNIRHESNGLTYSQSKGGRTIFTIHAGRSVPHGEGQWTLEDAVLILYGKDGRDDRISGSQFEYDERQGVLRAVGEVHLDLQAPGSGGRGAHPGLSFAPENATAADPGLIHVRTSGLTYQRKLDLATTAAFTEFRYKGMTCTSQGAAFDAGHDVLRLLSQVRLEGAWKATPFTLRAAETVLDRQAETVELLRPVLDAGDRNSSADHALLHLHPDGSLEQGDAEGAVEVRSGSEWVEAPRAHAAFGAENHPRELQMAGGVRFADADPARPMMGSAEGVELRMDEAGMLRQALGKGSVRMSTRMGGSQGALREATADMAEASFVPQAGKAELQGLKLTGKATLSGVSPATHGGAASSSKVFADMLVTSFAASAGGTTEPQRMSGSGHTRLEQASADGAHTLSSGDTLTATFAARANGQGVVVSQAVQTGHVEVQSWPVPKPPATTAVPSLGRAQRAVFTADAGTLVLSGEGAEVHDGATVLIAPSITLHQGTGDAEASGGVTATSTGSAGGPATHVLAERAALLHTAQLSEFFGTPGRPAQLWQAGSQVRAAKLVLDGPQQSLNAQTEAPGEVVQAVFASAGAAIAGAASGHVPPRRGSEDPLRAMPAASRDAVAVRAGSLRYSDLQHEAVLGGGVEIQGAEGVMTGEHGTVFLHPPARSAAARAPGNAPGVEGLGGQLERLVLVGDVHFRQPGRTGLGTQLTYTAASGDYVLTGTPAQPPRMVDAQQGSVTGTTLLFRSGESSIVVAGQKGGVAQGQPARVHTETDLRPQ